MAYAAVISLKNTIHRLKNLINIPQIRKSLHDELDSLRSMLKRLDDESSRMIDRSVINELDGKIREAAWKLEDVLESYHSLNISPSQGDGEKMGSSKKKKKKEKSCSLVPLVDEIKMEMDSFLKTVKLLREEYKRELLQKPLPVENDEVAAVPPINKSTTVRLSDLSQNIINGLLSDGLNPLTYGLVPDPHFVSLVGMAGIGKTHLAALIYHHPRIVQHFHVRLWVRAGPKYQLNIIYADILSQLLHKPRDLFKEESVDTLRDLIGSSLRRTWRYLIVLDDIWTTQVVYDIRSLHIRGRFLITTRLQEVAEYENATIHRMPFLNNEESWNLLWQNVFVAEKSFPPQLEKPGRKIAENCEGLPLLILAVANILRGLDKTEESWKMVAEKKTTTFTDAYDQIYEVLLPSYEYLPQHLKPCFLHMGVFPQSCEIPFSKLSNLWAVEDILDPTLIRQLARFDKYTSQQQKLKEFAIKCMKDLVSRSLAIVCKQRFKGYYEWIKSSKLHSAYWYLCITEARKSKFFHVLSKLTDVSIEKQRRLAVQNNILLGFKEVYDSMAAATSTTRSLLCTGEDHKYPVRICFNMMLLMRVLDALAIRFYEFPSEVLKLLQLRYLSLTHNGELPSSINKLQQLHYLILRRHHNIKFPTTPGGGLPEEIWDMQELRHLWIMGSNLPDPIKGAQLPKLLRLHVNADSCTNAVFKSIWNLKKLRIKIELEPDAAAETVRYLEHIGVLNKLDSLKCVVVNPLLQSQLAVAPPDHLSNLPWGLTKLSLSGLGYSWKYTSVIGSLPILKVLKLRFSAFQGPHWEIESGQFQSLEFLLLEDIDLVQWTAQDSSRHNLYGRDFEIYDELFGADYNGCFLRLKHLIVRHCYKLKKIPYIQSLEMMEVDDCSPSVVASAQQIKEKIEKKEVTVKSFDFQLIINSTWK